MMDNPNLLRELLADLEPRIQRAAEKGAAILKQNVSGRGHGTGQKYPSLPNRSSAPGQFPVYQSGELHDSVDHNPTNDPLIWEVGFFGLNQKRLNGIEWGHNESGIGGRAPLRTTLEDAETKRQMLAATEG